MRKEKKHAEVGKRVRNTRKDQSMAGVINFILTGVHAACMHCMQSCQNWAQAWIDFDEGSWCTTISPHHQDGYAITFDSSACILHALHADLSRLWVLLEIQKSKWYVASRPLPYAGFFMKRRKYKTQEVSGQEEWGKNSRILEGAIKTAMLRASKWAPTLYSWAHTWDPF